MALKQSYLDILHETRFQPKLKQVLSGLSGFEQFFKKR